MNKLSAREWVLVSVCCVIFVALVMVIIVGNFEKLKQEPEKSYYEIKCEAFGVQNSNLSKNQIVFIGDSITDGYKLDNYYADLDLATYNRGINGDTSSGVLARLQTSLIDLAPSKVVLMIGINDIGLGRTNDEIIANYTAILSNIKQNLPTTKVFCMSVLPVGTQLLDYISNEQVVDLNSKISQLAAQRDCQFVDIYSDFVTQDGLINPEYTIDGIHPNAVGYDVWTNKIKPLLQ
ncbi:MAG: hypothetical protein IKQ31_01415 [Clostridia bacterium]|nr:hypothetical protein [Clostridia bacterium]